MVSQFTFIAMLWKMKVFTGAFKSNISILYLELKNS